MEFNNEVCGQYLADDKIYAAHIVTRIVREDLVVGLSKLKDWISHLRTDDLYIIIRSLEDHGDEYVYQDILECVRLMLYIENGKEIKIGNEEESVNDLLIFLNHEYNTRTKI